MADEPAQVFTEPSRKAPDVGRAAAALRAQMAGQSPIDTGVAPPPPPAEPPVEKPRNDKGQFVKPDDAPPPPPAEDPSKAAMREVIKRFKAKEREAERRIAELERQRSPMAPAAPPPADPEAELLSTMPDETKTWWKNTGNKLVDIRINTALSAREAEAARHKAAGDAETEAFHTAVDDFVADRLIDNEVVDDRKFRGFLAQIDADGYRFGRDDATHIEQAFKMFKTVAANASTPVRSAEDTEKAAKAAAAAAARSGGTPPSTAAPPTMDRGEYGKKLREATIRGDHNEVSRLMRERLRGTSLDRMFNPRASQEG